jgi:hypothetical protein
MGLWHSRSASEWPSMSTCSSRLASSERFCWSSFGTWRGTSTSTGRPPTRSETHRYARAGDQLSFESAFITNLTRGVYSIEVTLFDPDRQSPLIAVLRTVKQFRIVEDVSHHGVANLYLSGSMVSATRAPVPEHSRGGNEDAADSPKFAGHRG